MSRDLKEGNNSLGLVSEASGLITYNEKGEVVIYGFKPGNGGNLLSGEADAESERQMQAVFQRKAAEFEAARQKGLFSLNANGDQQQGHDQVVSDHKDPAPTQKY